MIKFGFNTLAMLTFGLGVRMPWHHVNIPFPPVPVVEFRNKPPGVAVEDKTGQAAFADRKVEMETTEVEFEVS